MFGFWEKDKKKENQAKQEANNRKYEQFASDGKYEQMVNDYSTDVLAGLVEYEDEPYVLSIDELQYMITICNDVEKKGVIYYAIATCYYNGVRGAVESRKKGMEYDQKSMDAQNSEAALRYGVNLTLDVGDALKEGTMDEGQAKIEHAYGVGCVVKSYRQGCERARDVLELFMDGRDEFYGARSVEELVRKWPDSFR